MSTIYSMTGYASVRGGEGDGTGFTLTVKSVNHRFLDLHFRMPSYCDGLEVQLRRVLRDYLKRGHVEVTLQVERRVEAQVRLKHELMGAYVEAFREASAIYDDDAKIDLNALLRIPGVMSVESSAEPVDAAEFEASVLSQVDGLVAKLNEVRAQEGTALVAELRGSMERLRDYAGEVAELRVGVRMAQMERLKARLTELLQGADVREERVLEEAALLVERSDIEEEMVRLRTHVERFLAMLEEGGELGKRLDFLLQELNREANTMLSKTGSAAGTDGLRITELGLEMKAEIEKAREQVQNLE